MTTTEKKTRKPVPRIKVSLRPEQADLIKQQAKQAGLSVSAYLRRVGLGSPINSILDYQAVDTLAKVNGDLGRLGGLLKLWLSDDEKLAQFEPLQLQQAIVSALQKISQNQEELHSIILTIIKQ